MKDTDYAQATGYLRVVEKRMLNNSAIERVIDAPSGEEALKVLSQNSEFDFSTIDRIDDYELVLGAELKNLYKSMYNLCPEKDIVNVLSAKYGYHNIKVAIKAKYLSKDHDHLFIDVTQTSPLQIKSGVMTGDVKDLPEHILQAVNQGVLAFEEYKDPQMTDIVIDKLMFGYMLGLCENMDIEFITDYVKTLIDFYNLKTLVRVKNLEKSLKFLTLALVSGGKTDIEGFTKTYDKATETLGEGFVYKYFGQMTKQSLEGYEKIGNFSVLEKMSDNHLLTMAKEAKYIAFGPEPLFAFIIAKENEIKQIRILITCKTNSISSNILRERLRDNYA